MEERQSHDTRCALGKPKRGPSANCPKTRACQGFLTIASCILTFVCVLTRFFIKFPKQTGNLYDIESPEFIHLFCFELEVIRLL